MNYELHVVVINVISACFSLLGHVLRSITGSSVGSDVGSVSSTGEEGNREGDPQEKPDGEPLIPPDHGQCSYCGSVMPQLRLLMHERHCAQSNFKCPICK